MLCCVGRYVVSVGCHYNIGIKVSQQGHTGRIGIFLSDVLPSLIVCFKWDRSSQGSVTGDQRSNAISTSVFLIGCL